MYRSEVYQFIPIDTHLWLMKSCLQRPREVSDDLLAISSDSRKGLDMLVLVKQSVGFGVIPHCLRICTHVEALLEPFRQLKEELQLCGCKEEGEKWRI